MARLKGTRNSVALDIVSGPIARVESLTTNSDLFLYVSLYGSPLPNGCHRRRLEAQSVDFEAGTHFRYVEILGPGLAFRKHPRICVFMASLRSNRPPV